MKPEDRKVFATVVLGFAELKGKSLSAAAVDLYWNAMVRKNWTLAEFCAAAEHLVAATRFMPEPYDFEQLRKAKLPTAGEAWVRAREAINGKWHSELQSSAMTCGDPFIDRVVRMIGGYGALAMCNTDKLGFLERRFAEHFETLQDAGEVREALPQLEGHPPRHRLNGPAPIGRVLEHITDGRDDE
jgi:hypothetical protein